MQVDQHFTMLVYPFRHSVDGQERADRLRKLGSRWQPWWCRFDSVAVSGVLDDTFFFLPHVRELLFPETKWLRDPGSTVFNAEFQALLALQTPDELAKYLGNDDVIRLTCTANFLDTLRPLRLEFRLYNEGVNEEDCFRQDFDLCWIDVVLFPQRVGMLVLKVQLPAQALSVAHTSEFLFHARAVHPPRIGWKMPEWITDPDGHRRRARSAVALLDELLQDLTTPSYSVSAAGQVYGQHFRMYTFACLRNEIEANAFSAPTPSAEAAPPVQPVERSVFASHIDLALYELATCSDIHDSDAVPHLDYAERLFAQHRIALWANWQGLALQDSVVFLGVQSTPFVRETLGRNIENDYLYLYLLTQYQKMRLLLFAGELVRSSENLYSNLREARCLSRDFVLFRNRFWFDEVTRGFQGTELYRHFRGGMNVHSVYEEVRSEVAEMQEHYEEDAQRRLSWSINFLTFIVVPASILASVFSAAMIKTASLRDVGAVSLVVYGVAAAIWLIGRRLGSV